MSHEIRRKDRALPEDQAYAILQEGGDGVLATWGEDGYPYAVPLNHALEDGVFKKRKARDIATSLKRSAERSQERKSAPLRSAMSMLTFYINRAGKNMSASRRRTLEAAKGELRRLFA